MNQDIRWRQRFQNYDRAVRLLGEPVARGLAQLSDLEKEGTVQRFEVAVELAWKTLKDYLEYEGRQVDLATPRQVLKEAYAARILPDGQVWIDMLDHRNLLSHTYDEQTFARAVAAIGERYFPALAALQSWFASRPEAVK